MVSGALAAAPVGRGEGFFVTALTNGPTFVFTPELAAAGVGVLIYPVTVLGALMPSSFGRMRKFESETDEFSPWIARIFPPARSSAGGRVKSKTSGAPAP